MKLRLTSAASTSAGRPSVAIRSSLARILFPLERIDDFPVGLHVDHGPFALDGLVPRLVELADMALAVVGELAHGIGVMDEAHEARAGTARGILQHLLVAVGVAEGEDRAAADEAVDADRLARPVVDELDL